LGGQVWVRSVNWLQNVGIEVMKNPRQGFVVGGQILEAGSPLQRSDVFRVGRL
jgi:hypothetical protein